MKNWFKTILVYLSIGLALVGIQLSAHSFELSLDELTVEHSCHMDHVFHAIDVQDQFLIVSASAWDRMPWESLAVPFEITEEEDSNEKDNCRSFSGNGLIRHVAVSDCLYDSHLQRFGQRIAISRISNSLFILFAVFRI